MMGGVAGPIARSPDGDKVAFSPPSHEIGDPVARWRSAHTPW